MHYLTRRFRFSASHALASPALDEAEAERCFGMCRRVHGHNWTLEVTVRGEPDPRTGFFCNVLDLRDVVQRLVVDAVEHRHLDELPLFAGTVTTMEGIASAVWGAIEAPLAERGMELHEVLVGETEDDLVRLRRD